MKYSSVVFAFALMLLCISAAPGQIPRTLSYQGILTDSLGNPKTDADYLLTFHLYDAAAGGSALWTETKVLRTNRGLFSTVLGDSVPFDTSVRFDKKYWLSVQVGAESELSPRVPLNSVAYSLNSSRADTARFAQSGGSIPDSSITGGSVANHQLVRSLNSLHDNITLAPGVNVTILTTNDSLIIASTGGGNLSGTGVANGAAFWNTPTSLAADTNFTWENTLKRLGIGTATPTSPLTVQRTAVAPNEIGIHAMMSGDNSSAVRGDATGINTVGVWGIATSPAGSNTGVYGITSSFTGFGVYGYNQATSGGAIGVNGLADSPEGIGVLGTGEQSGVEGTSSHGYGGYFVSDSGTALYAKGRTTVAGTMTVDSITYPSPKKHYYTVGGEAFTPQNNVDYANSGGMGGVYIYSGLGTLNAPVHLPDGATITGVTIYFYDNSASDLSLYLFRGYITGGYDVMAQFTPTGTPGYSSVSTTTIQYGGIDNQHYGYLVKGYCPSWDGANLRIMAATFEYTVPGPQ